MIVLNDLVKISARLAADSTYSLATPLRRMAYRIKRSSILMWRVLNNGQVMGASRCPPRLLRMAYDDSQVGASSAPLPADGQVMRASKCPRCLWMALHGQVGATRCPRCLWMGCISQVMGASRCPRCLRVACDHGQVGSILARDGGGGNQLPSPEQHPMGRVR